MKELFMIPPFDERGLLPPGVHTADSWDEFMNHFGTSLYRKVLISGLNKALYMLRDAGCTTVYVDGSFVSKRDLPNDFDACWLTDNITWSKIDRVFLDFSNGRAAQKAKFHGEFFPASAKEMSSGRTFLEFFQEDKDTGMPKGIVAIDLRRLP